MTSPFLNHLSNRKNENSCTTNGKVASTTAPITTLTTVNWTIGASFDGRQTNLTDFAEVVGNDFIDDRGMS